MQNNANQIFGQRTTDKNVELIAHVFKNKLKFKNYFFHVAVGYV